MTSFCKGKKNRKYYKKDLIIFDYFKALNINLRIKSQMVKVGNMQKKLRIFINKYGRKLQ